MMRLEVDHLLLGLGVDGLEQRRAHQVAMLRDDRSLHERRGRDHAGGFREFLQEAAPVADGAVRADIDLRLEAEHLVLELVIEPGHDGNDNDRHGDAQGDPENRDEGDDRDEGPFRLQVAQAEKEAEREFHARPISASTGGRKSRRGSTRRRSAS